MGAWAEGMQGSDTALDWIAAYQDFGAKKGIPLNKKGRDVVAGKRPLREELDSILKKSKYSWAQGILGVAEFFLDNGADLKESRPVIHKAIKNQLTKAELGTWRDPELRREALLRFQDRMMGKKVDPEKVAADNEGLFSRMGRMLGG